MWNLIFVLLAILMYCYKSTFFQILDPVAYSVSLPDKFDGPLKVNDKLEKVEKLHQNAIHWPESMAMHGGEIYTGLGDGRIVRISSNSITNICRMGKECDGQHEEHVCGRPLGMRFNKEGVLYVVDAYHGLFSVNVETGEKIQLLPSSTLVDDKPLMFLNSLALDEKEGAVYMSQSSTKWNISMSVISVLEHESSGRLLKYNLKTRKVSVLLTGLFFANGVELSHDGTSVLVAELGNHKIFKYHISGPLKGQRKDLPIILPGEPDNISRNPRGNYWIGIGSGRTTESPTILDRLSEQAFVRKVFLHLYKLVTLPFAALIKLVPQQWAQEKAFEAHSGRCLASLIKSHGIIVEFDDNGNIVQSLHSPSGTIAHISEVLEHDGYLYLGSWQNRYLGRVKV